MTRPLIELLDAADALKVAPLYADRDARTLDAHYTRHEQTGERLRARFEVIAELAHRDMIASELADALKTANERLQAYEREIGVRMYEAAKAESERDDLRAKLAEAEEAWHLANGVADLAMKHRDLAERDAVRLSFIQREYIKVEPTVLPTGGGDADVGWRLTDYYESDPQERVVAEIFRDDLREAIDAAIAKEKP